MAVLITRPDERGAQLVEMLNKIGIMAIHFPLFNIEAGRELNDLSSKINKLKPDDYLFAVSKNAVTYATKTLKDTGFYWRSDLHYFTVGRGTAACFASQTEQSVHYPIEQETSEGLLALPQMQDLTGKQILILRGNGGREYFSEQARLRGANVETIECYQRVPLNYQAEEQISLCQRLAVNTLVITSMDVLNYLVELVPESAQQWLKNCCLVTVSERIAQFARNLGWENVIISPRADNQSLLKTLQFL